MGRRSKGEGWTASTRHPEPDNCRVDAYRSYLDVTGVKPGCQAHVFVGSPFLAWFTPPPIQSTFRANGLHCLDIFCFIPSHQLTHHCTPTTSALRASNLNQKNP
jgi:hypothetical protein